MSNEVLRVGDGLRVRFMVLAEAKMERVAPAILIELGRQVVEGICHVRIIRAVGRDNTHSNEKQRFLSKRRECGSREKKVILVLIVARNPNINFVEGINFFRTGHTFAAHLVQLAYLNNRSIEMSEWRSKNKWIVQDEPAGLDCRS